LSGNSKVICKTYKQLINEFMKVLSLAHECVREKVKDDYVYRGPSPDEVQLVEFARDLNFTFLG
jgi:magnesium-transporting ATPase (P-type)